MKPVRKFFFRYRPDEATIRSVVGYLNEFGHGRATVASQGPFKVLYIQDRRDIDLVRHEFGHMLDAWVDLRQ